MRLNKIIFVIVFLTSCNLKYKSSLILEEINEMKYKDSLFYNIEYKFKLINDTEQSIESIKNKIETEYIIDSINFIEVDLQIIYDKFNVPTIESISSYYKRIVPIDDTLQIIATINTYDIYKIKKKEYTNFMSKMNHQDLFTIKYSNVKYDW